MVLQPGTRALLSVIVLLLPGLAVGQTRLYLTNKPSGFAFNVQGSWHFIGTAMELMPSRYCLPGTQCPQPLDTYEDVSTFPINVHVVTGVSEEINVPADIHGKLCCKLGIKEDNSVQDNTYRVHALLVGHEGDVNGVLVDRRHFALNAANEWPQPERVKTFCVDMTPAHANQRDRLWIEIGARQWNNSNAKYFSRVLAGGDIFDHPPCTTDGAHGRSCSGWCELEDVSLSFGPPLTMTPTHTPTGTPPTATPTPTPTRTPTMTPTGFMRSFVVNTVYNCDDDGIGDGFCSSIQCGSDGECSLRAAIQECNTLASGSCLVEIDRSVVPRLNLSSLPTTGGTCRAGACSGNGCVKEDLPTITSAIVLRPMGTPTPVLYGPGKARTFGEAMTIGLYGSTSRFVRIAPGGSLRMEHIYIVDWRIRTSVPPTAGVIWNDGELDLHDVVIHSSDNTKTQAELAVGMGGRGSAIYNTGMLRMDSSMLWACKGNWGSCLYNIGTVDMTNSTCMDPIATGMDRIDRAGTYQFPRLCVGGLNAGAVCSTNADCPGAGSYCGNSSGTCIGDLVPPINDGADCLDDGPCDPDNGGYCSGGGIGWGDTAGGGGCLANFRISDAYPGRVRLSNVTFRLGRARLGMGGGAILNGTHDFGGPEGWEGAGGHITCVNCTFAKDRSRLMEGGVIVCHNGGRIDLSYTSISDAQSAKRSALVIYDGCELRTKSVYIGGYTISEPPTNFANCVFSALGSINFTSDDPILDFYPSYTFDDGCTHSSGFCGVLRRPCGPGVVSLPKERLLVVGDYGGSIETTPPDPTSALIDAGESGPCTDLDGNVVTTDARGLPRPSGSKCDIGAVEIQQ